MKDLIVTKDNLLVQHLDQKEKFSPRVKEREDDIIRQVQRVIQDWSWRRQDLEYLWKACWAHYFNTPQSANYLRQEALSLGQSSDENDWRHKVHTGKGFDLVETVNSYLQQAFFPNEDWFELEPLDPMAGDDWKAQIQQVKYYLRKKLKQAYFEDWWDIFCRQMCVVGTSILALPWRYDAFPTPSKVRVRQADGAFKTEVVEKDKVIYNGVDIEVIDLFDFFLDPEAMFSSYVKCNCLRRVRKTKAEVLRLIRAKVYVPQDVEEAERKVLNSKGYSYLDNDTDKDRQDLKAMVGLEYWESEHDLNHTVEMWEYWGNLCLGDIEYQDVVVTIIDDCLLNIEQNPFWDGKPFVIGTYINTQNSPYGVGLLQPVVGQLHQMFIVQNHRLDISELTINPMYQVMNDGVLDLENLYSAPGKILEVAEIGNIAPIPIEKDNTVSVQDEQLLEARIDKTTGVGAYLGVQSGRDAERVTAEEVKAERDAGGNRLNRIHTHIETTSLHCFLHKMYSHCQQFVEDDEVVRVPGQEYGITYDFWLVGVGELSTDYDIIPLGAAHVADKEYELKNATDFVAIMSANPDLAMKVNWEEVASYLARKFFREKWEKFVTTAQPTPATPTSAMPMETAPNSMEPSLTQSMTQPPVPSDAGSLTQMMGEQNPMVQEAYGAMGNPGGQMMTELMQDPEMFNKLMTNGRKQIYGRK